VLGGVPAEERGDHELGRKFVNDCKVSRPESGEVMMEKEDVIEVEGWRRGSS